jgi:hypothetical protein
VGIVYYRVDISIKKCRLQGKDISPFGYTPIRVKPGEVFSASSSCK